MPLHKALTKGGSRLLMNRSENNLDLLIGCSLAFKIVGKNTEKNGMS